MTRRELLFTEGRWDTRGQGLCRKSEGKAETSGLFGETQREGVHWEFLLLVCGDNGVLTCLRWRCHRRRNKEHTNTSTTFGAVPHVGILAPTGAKMVTTMDIYARGMAWRSDFRPCIEWGWHLGYPGDRSGGQEWGRTPKPRKGCLHGARQTGKLRDGARTTRMTQGCGAFNSS